MQARNYHYYAVIWILSISDKRLWSKQGDKVLIWWKKMAAMTRIFPRTFLKIDAAWELKVASSMLNTKWIKKAVL